MYCVDGQTIEFSNGKFYKFQNIVAEVLEFDDTLVVRLGSEPMQLVNENVFGFDMAGKMLWQIPKRVNITGTSPYVSVSRKNNIFVEACNWNGHAVVLHPTSGKIVSEGLANYYGGMSARMPSRRNWI